MKKLTLKKETLAELTTDQLRLVLGGGGVDSYGCTSEQCSCEIASCNDIDLTGANDTLKKFLLVDC